MLEVYQARILLLLAKLTKIPIMPYVGLRVNYGSSHTLMHINEKDFMITKMEHQKRDQWAPNDN